MRAGDFAAYIGRAVRGFAHDKVESGQWSAESALELARQSFTELLPEGLQTPGHFLFTLHDTTTQESVGALWYAVQDRAGQRIACVYDILVEPRHRRMGRATQALAALESEVASRELSGIALHVFGHNHSARALYAKLGYVATNINMFKQLPSAGVQPLRRSEHLEPGAHAP